ncbi:unnamed protein product [Moneuplotes crassus]|uniref:Palmitoyltransferase n=1 Tax=Euplotes crassus TaxID=5936 RepID=A0AAD1XLD4_EUPCR|nr:unnamed protein product [Moneuplotes crassus]
MAKCSANLIFVAITYLIVIGVDANFVFIGILPEISSGNYVGPYLHFAFVQCIVFLIFWSHTVCMMSNPGCFPKEYRKLDLDLLSEGAKEFYQVALDAIEEKKRRKQALENNQLEEVAKLRTMYEKTSKIKGMTGTEKDLLIALFKNKCRKCKSLKPPKSHHCSQCNACIARMDHHCPWVNNCVGISNQKSFILFCIYVCFGSMYALSVTIYYTYHCIYEQCVTFIEPIATIMNCVGIFLAVLFASFTGIMFYDQMWCIIFETSTIDKLKKTLRKESGKGTWELIKESFGEDFSLRWFIPIQIERKITIESQY